MRANIANGLSREQLEEFVVADVNNLRPRYHVPPRAPPQPDGAESDSGETEEPEKSVEMDEEPNDNAPADDAPAEVHNDPVGAVRQIAAAQGEEEGEGEGEGEGELRGAASGAAPLPASVPHPNSASAAIPPPTATVEARTCPECGKPAPSMCNGKNCGDCCTDFTCNRHFCYSDGWVARRTCPKSRRCESSCHHTCYYKAEQEQKKAPWEAEKKAKQNAKKKAEQNKAKQRNAKQKVATRK